MLVICHVLLFKFYVSRELWNSRNIWLILVAVNTFVMFIFEVICFEYVLVINYYIIIIIIIGHHCILRVGCKIPIFHLRRGVLSQNGVIFRLYIKFWICAALALWGFLHMHAGEWSIYFRCMVRERESGHVDINENKRELSWLIELILSWWSGILEGLDVDVRFTGYMYNFKMIGVSDLLSNNNWQAYSMWPWIFLEMWNFAIKDNLEISDNVVVVVVVVWLLMLIVWTSWFPSARGRSGIS